MAGAVDNYSDLELSEEEADPLGAEFSRAAAHLKNLATHLESAQLLELYAHYKQGTEGPCRAPRPRFFDTRGRAKWDAWSALGELPTRAAMQAYVRLIRDADATFATGGKRAEVSWAGAVSRPARRPEEEAEEAREAREGEEGAADDVWGLARAGREEGVRSLLAARPELAAARDERGMCAVHWAADRGHAGVLRALLAAGSGGGARQAALRDADGQSALHYAAACGHADAARLLLAAGADPRLRDLCGETPLELAADERTRDALRASDDR